MRYVFPSGAERLAGLASDCGLRQGRAEHTFSYERLRIYEFRRVPGQDCTRSSNLRHLRAFFILVYYLFVQDIRNPLDIHSTLKHKLGLLSVRFDHTIRGPRRNVARRTSVAVNVAHSILYMRVRSLWPGAEYGSGARVILVSFRVTGQLDSSLKHKPSSALMRFAAIRIVRYIEIALLKIF